MAWVSYLEDIIDRLHAETSQYESRFDRMYAFGSLTNRRIDSYSERIGNLNQEARRLHDLLTSPSFDVYRELLSKEKANQVLAEENKRLCREAEIRIKEEKELYRNILSMEKQNKCLSREITRARYKRHRI